MNTNAKTHTDIKYVYKKNIKQLHVLNIQKHIVMINYSSTDRLKKQGDYLKILKQFKVFELVNTF